MSLKTAGPLWLLRTTESCIILADILSCTPYREILIPLFVDVYFMNWEAQQKKMTIFFLKKETLITLIEHLLQMVYVPGVTSPHPKLEI